MKELAKNCITLLADLFQRIEEYAEFPIENMVLSSHLVQLCSWIKSGSCLTSDMTVETCQKAYDLSDLGKNEDAASLI